MNFAIFIIRLILGLAFSVIISRMFFNVDTSCKCGGPDYLFGGNGICSVFFSQQKMRFVQAQA
jgi:hypothetical protein